MKLTNGSAQHNGETNNNDHHLVTKRHKTTTSGIQTNNGYQPYPNSTVQPKDSGALLRKGVHRRFVASVHWEPGILTGYRVTGQPWTFYLRSLFWMHNESVNVWSHLLGVVICGILTWSFTKDVDFSSDASSHGILLFTAGCSASFLSSASAHLFNSKSELVHYTFFCLDYIGISLYGYSYGMMTYYVSGSQDFYQTLGGLFPIMHAVITVNQTLWNIMARVLYRNNQCSARKSMQVIPCALGVISSEIPLIFRLCKGIPNTYHFYHFFFTITNGLLFSIHQPEKKYKGRFDLWGNSHQWFHLSVILTAVFQLLACHDDLLNQPRTVLDLAQPNITTMWASLAAVFAINVLLLLYLFPRLKENCAR